MGLFCQNGPLHRKLPKPPGYHMNESANCDRFPPMWYTSQGKEFVERLWDETLVELDLAGH